VTRRGAPGHWSGAPRVCIRFAAGGALSCGQSLPAGGWSSSTPRPGFLRAVWSAPTSACSLAASFTNPELVDHLLVPWWAP